MSTKEKAACTRTAGSGIAAALGKNRACASAIIYLQRERDVRNECFVYRPNLFQRGENMHAREDAFFIFLQDFRFISAITYGVVARVRVQINCFYGLEKQQLDSAFVRARRWAHSRVRRIFKACTRAVVPRYSYGAFSSADRLYKIRYFPHCARLIRKIKCLLFSAKTSKSRRACYIFCSHLSRNNE